MLAEKVKQSIKLGASKLARRSMVNIPTNNPSDDQLPISYFQIFGIIIMVFSVIRLCFIDIHSDTLSTIISIDFFLIMLGFAITFPEMLSDETKGLSTMRMVVFMVTNIICMIFINVGFKGGIISLKDVGIDSIWLGLFAFIFGAKAIQSFFESNIFGKRIVNNDEIDQKSSQEDQNNKWENLNEEQQYSLISDCINTNEDKWFLEYPNITGIGYGMKQINDLVTNTRSIVFHVPIKQKPGDKIISIPKTIVYNGFVIPTDIIKSQSGSANSYVKPDSIYPGEVNNPKKIGSGISRIKEEKCTGTLGLIVKRNDGDSNKRYLLTCFHVLFPEKISEETVVETLFDNFGEETGVICPSAEDESQFNNSVLIANAYKGKFGKFVDCGIAELIDDTIEPKLFDGTALNGKYTPDSIDVKIKTSIKMFGRTSRWQSGRILQTNVSKIILYNGNISRRLSNLIQVTKISSPGDSGACVMLKNTNKVIGILVATDEINDYSYVIPINSVLNSLNVTL